MFNIKEKLNILKDQILQITPLEKKVREATSNDNWGPTVTSKRELAEATSDYGQFKEVMGMLWLRMGESGKNYRIVQKSLALLQYLLIHGSKHVFNEAKVEVHNIKRLQAFYFTEDNGKEMGQGVRQSAKEVCRILRDNEYYQEKRKEGKRIRNRFKGFSKQESRWRTPSPTSDSDDFSPVSSPKKRNSSRSSSRTSSPSSPQPTKVIMRKSSYDDDDFSPPRRRKSPFPKKKKSSSSNSKHVRKPSFGNSNSESSSSEEENAAVVFTKKKNKKKSKKIKGPVRLRKASGGEKKIKPSSPQTQPQQQRQQPKQQPKPQQQQQQQQKDTNLMSFFDAPAQSTNQNQFFTTSTTTTTTNKKKNDGGFGDFGEENDWGDDSFPDELSKNKGNQQQQQRQQQPQQQQQRQPVNQNMNMFFDVGHVMTPTNLDDDDDDLIQNNNNQQQQQQEKGEKDELLNFFENTFKKDGKGGQNSQGGNNQGRKLTIRELRERQERQQRRQQNQQQRQGDFPASFYSLNHPAPYQNVQGQSPQQQIYQSPNQYVSPQQPRQNTQQGGSTGLESFF